MHDHRKYPTWMSGWMYEFSYIYRVHDFQRHGSKFPDVLCGFYANVRKKDGAEYSKSGLVNIRASLNRFFAGTPIFKTNQFDEG